MTQAWLTTVSLGLYASLVLFLGLNLGSKGPFVGLAAMAACGLVSFTFGLAGSIICFQTKRQRDVPTICYVLLLMHALPLTGIIVALFGGSAGNGP